MFLDPLGQLSFLVVSRKSFVRKNHNTVVRFASNGATDTLRRVSHCVEREEVVLSDLKLISEVIQPGAQDSGLSVDVRNAEHEDSPAQMVVEVDAFGDFTSGHGQEDSSSAALASLQRRGQKNKKLNETEPSENILSKNKCIFLVLLFNKCYKMSLGLF